MKKVAFFLFLLVFIPTTSLAASGVTFEDCVNYMQKFTSSENENFEFNNDFQDEMMENSTGFGNMMNNTNYRSRSRMMNNSNYRNGSMMDESSDFYQNMPCHQ